MLAYSCGGCFLFVDFPRGWLVADAVFKVGDFELLELLCLLCVRVLGPHNHIIELALRNQDLVKASEVFVLLVHDSEDPHAVALDLLDWVSEQSQRLQLIEVL